MSIEAMKQALEALEWNLVVIEDYGYKEQLSRQHKAIESLRQAIAEAEKQQDIFKQLSSQSMLQLWQRYCDVKVERDELKDKLAKADKQEPVAWASENVIPLRPGKDNHPCILTGFKCEANTIPLYTHPSKREFVGLTDDEMLMIYGQQHKGKKYNLGRMVEAKLKEKNT
jgi:hypothetical protein